MEPDSTFTMVRPLVEPHASKGVSLYNSVAKSDQLAIAALLSVNPIFIDDAHHARNAELHRTFQVSHRPNIVNHGFVGAAVQYRGYVSTKRNYNCELQIASYKTIGENDDRCCNFHVGTFLFANARTH
eukprot:5320345-Pyramimonas_sp.AAC.1